MKNLKMQIIVRKLRKNQTGAELLLWQELRNRKLGVKFRRQAPFVFGIINMWRIFIAEKRN